MKDKIILLEGFNTHYPVWGDRVVALKLKSKYFLIEIGRRALYLLILPGEVI